VRGGALRVSGHEVLVADCGQGLSPWRLRALPVGRLACLVGLTLGTLVVAGSSGDHRPNSQRIDHDPVPSGLLAAASRSIGASEHSFWPVRRGHALLAQAGQIDSDFTNSGAMLRVPGGTLGLSLAYVARGKRLHRVDAVAPSGSANEILYRHGSVVESYRTGPYGLEQEFTVDHRPRPGRGPLVLAMGLAGSLVPRQAGSEVLFRTAAGATRLRYGQLSVVDATGSRLPSHIQLRDGKLLLQINDRRASYPVRIDPFVSEPFVQQGEKLTAVGEGGSGAFGTSVALSADGNTALIAGSLDETRVGAAWIFTRSGSTWSQQGGTLAPEGEGAFNDFHSLSVALSSDGQTALIGGSSNNLDGSFGSAWVFTRSGSTWVQQGVALLPAGEYFTGAGLRVALSGDGNTALIGSPEEAPRGGPGAAWVFVRSGSTWTQQGGKITGSAEEPHGLFGGAVALSANGTTALIGGADENMGAGAAWVFTRSGSTWTQQGEKLTGSGELGPGGFGASVALSAEGNTALIGGSSMEQSAGAAWVFIRSDSTWTQQDAKLTGIGESQQVGSFGFGTSVALSADGSVAVVGDPGDESDVGAVWSFARTGSTWTQLGQEFTGGGEVGEGEFGGGVALAADGNTVVVGGVGDAARVGAAWVFTHPTPTVTTGVASAVTQSAATLSATVDPNGGAVTECWIEYGTTPSYGSRVPCSSGSGAGASPVPVSAAIGGLAANATYHFRAVATNLAGVGYGEDGSFQTPPNPPVVVTGIASSVSSSYATLNATVNPNGGQTSTCRFEYGTSASYGSSVACSPPEQGGESPVAVTSAIPVNANAGYHFRIVAANGGGTSYGSDETFKAPLPPLPRITASMTWRFAWSRRFAIVRSLTVHAVPQGGHVEVSCKGHGCPFTRVRSASVEKHVSCRSKKCPMRRVQGPTFALASLFKGRHLDSGARIAVSIVKPGWVGKSYVFTMRANTEPQYQLGCLAPGSTQPGRGC
jgi:hypothetical protein